MAVSGESLAIVRYQSPDHYDLYTWDPANGEQPIVLGHSATTHVAMWGDTVVWEDTRSGVSQIYMWDPVNGERPVSPSSYAQTNPKIYADTIVWEDASYYYWGSRAIMMWNPREGKTRVATGHAPAIWGDRVVYWFEDYWDDDYPWNGPNSGLWEWTPGNGERRLIDDSQISGHAGLDIWGDLVVFAGNQVKCIDSSGEISQVSESLFTGLYSFGIYEDKIAWSGNYDIYLATLVPEPSSLLGLAGCAGLLLGLVRRRFR